MVAPPRLAGRVKVTSGGSGAAITRTGASMRRQGRASASRRLSAISRALPTAAPMAWSRARSVASGTWRRLPKKSV